METVLGTARAGGARAAFLAEVQSRSRRVRHGHDRGDTDTGGYQHDGDAVINEIEIASRRSGFEDHPWRCVAVQPSTDLTVVLAFDADAVMPRGRIAGQRVATHRRRIARVGNLHRQVLTGARSR